MRGFVVTAATAYRCYQYRRGWKHIAILAAKKQRREDTRQRSKGAKIVANCLEVVEAVLVVTEVKIG